MYPSLLQIFTRVHLQELSGSLGRQALLADIPDREIDEWAQSGFDYIWLLGIWQTGEKGKQVSRSVSAWRVGFRAALPDLTEDDICGSPFAIKSYTVHEKFGDQAGLVEFRRRLRERGLKLLLDFVPNHTAIDHNWVFDHPEYYVRGSEEDLRNEPQNYICVDTKDGPTVLAYGRDPYFSGWPDTLQLNYRHPELKRAMRDELANIAKICDGVRCDMAMLNLPHIFLRTWGERALPADGTAADDMPFWPDAIEYVRGITPQFIFLAEVYWDLEWELQQQGFHYTYDKRLYDRLRAQDAPSVRAHLLAGLDFQNKLVRFLENHDEPRAAATFAAEVHEAAAVISFFTPGLRFFYEGQADGRRVHASMHLGRRPEEIADLRTQQFYRKLLVCLKRPEFRHGAWQLLDCRNAWEGNSTCQQFIAFAWSRGNDQMLIVVNYGPTQGQCYVSFPFEDWRDRQLVFIDLLGSAIYERNGNELLSKGLYVDMPAWGYHAFSATCS